MGKTGASRPSHLASLAAEPRWAVRNQALRRRSPQGWFQFSHKKRKPGWFTPSRFRTSARSQPGRNHAGPLQPRHPVDSAPLTSAINSLMSAKVHSLLSGFGDKPKYA